MIEKSNKSRSSNLYRSTGEAILVDERSNIGPRTDHYWFARRPIVVDTGSLQRALGYTVCPHRFKEAVRASHMIVEWRKPLEVEVDEGLSVCASDLYQEEDYPDK